MFGSRMRDVDASGSTAGEMPGAGRARRGALTQRPPPGRERRWVAGGRGHAAEERRDLRARLREAEDVVDEEQHVLAFLVAEVLRGREAREADAQARPGRLGHL